MAVYDVLVLGIVGIHSSYLKFLRRYSGQARELCILGSDILALIPNFSREIRAISPEDAAVMVAGLGLFPHLRILHLKDMPGLRGKRLVMPKDYICQKLTTDYSLGDVKFDGDFFLCYDPSNVRAAYAVPEFDGEITSDELFRAMMLEAEIAAANSTDWFRRIGACLFGDEGILVSPGWNARMPSDHEAWLRGDPRLYMEYGSDPELTEALHAEKMTLMNAANAGIATRDKRMAVSTYPCPNCGLCMVWAGISEVYVKEGYPSLNTPDVFAAYNVKVFRVI